MKTKLFAALAVAFAVLGLATPAWAHDITNPSGVCTAVNAADFTFTFSNFGFEHRYIKIYKGGTLLLDAEGLGGDGQHVLSVTGIDTGSGNQANVQFHFTSDAVVNGTHDISVDFTKCAPATTTTVPESSTTTSTTVQDTTTVPQDTTTTTVPESSTTTTVLVTTTTVPKDTTTSTTVPQTTTTVGSCAPLCAGQNGTTTTVPPTSSTAAPSATVVLQELPVPLPPVETPPTITTEAAKPSLPVTGAMTGREVAFGVALLFAGGAAVCFAKKVRSL